MSGSHGAAVENGRDAFSTHLDAIRALAALAVVAYHVRYKFFLDYADVSSPNLATTAFYVATSFGHDAVMIFFVLSGYLISGTTMKDLRARRWSWRHYLTNRLTRLYVVLLPGLALTMLWDRLGLWLFPTHVAYTGAALPWKHDLFDVSAASRWDVFLANAGFLQSLAGTPPLGSNSPLWSLTNELAYYLLFPAAMVALTAGRGLSRALSAAGVVILSYHFGARILLYFPIWLLGFVVLVAPTVRAPSERWAATRNLCAAAVLVAATSFRHTGLFNDWAGSIALEAGDYLVGVVFAGALWVYRLDTRTVSKGYSGCAEMMAMISFTLYVGHMPLLIFSRALLTTDRPWSATPATMTAAFLLLCASVLYGLGAWYLFERQTSRVRALVVGLFGRPSRLRQAAVR